MLKSLIFFVRFFLFWLFFFLADRLIFLLIFRKKLIHTPIYEVAAALYHAIRLDFSMAAYICILPLLSYLFWLFKSEKQVNFKWLLYYNRFLIILFSIISVINFNIYREWGSKINNKAIDFALTTPNEALASSASSPITFSLFLLISLTLFMVFIENNFIQKEIVFKKKGLSLKILIAFMLLAGNFLLIRGGWQLSPINQSMAYYSEKQILNHAAVNTEWNLLSSLISARKNSGNPYNYFKEEEAIQTVNNLYKTKADSTIKLLKHNRPNVVLFIMESFTADLTKTLGAENDVTPHFDSLINHGVFFNRVYSAGDRTDKGLIATLAAFPTLAANSVVKWPEKMQKLPAISQVLHQAGYHNSFFYGGESEFDNYKAFILSHSYQKLIDKNDFRPQDMNSKWGAYDEVVLKRQLHDLNKEKQPFFSTLLTLTNHEPFEVPGTYKFGRKDNASSFKSTAYYTDSCINAYLKEAKKQPWYPNTLFIFIADHGHYLPKMQHEIYDPARYHIPMLLYGDVIKDVFRGKQFSDVGSQLDLAATLLAQLQLSHQQFIWSKNLLDPSVRHFAFFSWDNGLGFADNVQSITFDNVGKKTLFNDNPKDKTHTDNLLKEGKSFLQKAYNQFIDL